MKLLTGNGRLVFPGTNDNKKPMSNNTILYALYRLGYRDRMTGHGFRGLASTILNENGFDEAHIELQLAHMKRNKVAAASFGVDPLLDSNGQRMSFVGRRRAPAPLID